MKPTIYEQIAAFDNLIDIRFRKNPFSILPQKNREECKDVPHRWDEILLNCLRMIARHEVEFKQYMKFGSPEVDADLQASDKADVLTYFYLKKAAFNGHDFDGLCKRFVSNQRAAQSEIDEIKRCVPFIKKTINLYTKHWNGFMRWKTSLEAAYPPSPR